MSRLLFVALLCLSAPAFGQGIGIPGPIPGDTGISVPSALTATVGSTVSIPISVTSTTGEVMFFGVDANCDGVNVAFTGATQSPGLLQHIADNGLPPNCDIVIYPTQAMIFMLPLVPYDITTYGAEYFFLDLDILATQPGTATVTFMSMTGTNPAPMTTTITIAAVGEPNFMRGDVNSDAACNISDAVALLSFMFSSGTTPTCLDSADVNDDGSITIADPVRLLNGLFGAGTPLAEGCQIDVVSTDTLNCAASSCP